MSVQLGTAARESARTSRGDAALGRPDLAGRPQDVELGRQAAAHVEQLPLLRDEGVKSSVASIGRQLVDAIPLELRHPEFRYSFQVVYVRDINAFACDAARRRPPRYALGSPRATPWSAKGRSAGSWDRSRSWTEDWSLRW